MKKVIVFGGAGFVGSRLCPLLQKKYDLTVVDTFWFWDSPEEYAEKVGIPLSSVVQEDIRDKGVKSLIKGKDVVINLACLSNDISSDIDYNFTHDVSYNGVMNVMNGAIDSRAPKIVQVSSTSVYGAKQGMLVTEKEIPEPITQYSTIKKQIDDVLLYHMKYTSSDITVLRPATLYGYSPRLRLDIMVNTLLNRAIEDNRLIIEGGEQHRPCLHVDDFANTFLTILKSPKSSNNIYNVTNENYTVNQVVDKIKQVLPEVELQYKHVLDQRSYRTSSSKIKKELGLKLPTKLNKSTIKALHQKIAHGDYNKGYSINLEVIKELIK